MLTSASTGTWRVMREEGAHGFQHEFSRALVAFGEATMLLVAAAALLAVGLALAAVTPAIVRNPALGPYYLSAIVLCAMANLSMLAFAHLLAARIVSLLTSVALIGAVNIWAALLRADIRRRATRRRESGGDR